MDRSPDSSCWLRFGAVAIPRQFAPHARVFGANGTVKSGIKFIIAGSALAVVAGWLLASVPPSPIAFIKVVDSSGKPVAGAVIKPDGLRPKKNGGHYRWTDRFPVKPLPVTTDSSGVARVPYPHFVEERLETGEISFSVDHPDFCSDRPFRVVAASPPTHASLRKKAAYYLEYALALVSRKASVRPDPVVLQRGATVEVSGYVGPKEARLPAVRPMISPEWWGSREFWREKEPGVLSTRKVPAGTNHLRLVYFRDGASTLFSDMVSFDAKVGETNRLDLELKPGSRVSGRLEDTVPRPVADGQVVAQILTAEIDPQSNPPIWHLWRPIAPDGTFVFDSVPRGRLEIIAICDGFVSQDGPSKRQTGQRTPQQFVIEQPAHDIVLQMEPTAACAVQILDDHDQPLPGAEVAFWPNVLWNDYGSTIFASDLYDTADLLKSPKRPDWSSVGDRKNRFSAVSDSHGIALVRDLPEHAGNDSFMVTHPAFEMPVHRDPGGEAYRYGRASVSAGQTNRVTVRLQKRGTQFVEH